MGRLARMQTLPLPYLKRVHHPSVNGVSFETPIIYQFPLQLPTDLLSVIIHAKYVISKSKLS